MKWLDTLLGINDGHVRSERRVGTSSVDNGAIYKDLPVVADSIRLVKLIGNGQLSLKVVSLPEAKNTRFYAVSYSWANSRDKAVWLCNDRSFEIPGTINDFFQQYLLRVKKGRRAGRHGYLGSEPAPFAGTNPSAVLEEDRYPWFWIDQICINQADSAEKLRQIGLMAFIYGSSVQTIVWLGNGGAKEIDDLRCLALNWEDQPMDTKLAALEVEQRASALSQSRRGGVGFASASRDNDSTIMNSLAVNEVAAARNRVKAYKRLFTLPFFGRIWVVQEVALSPQEPIAIYGNLTMSWKKIISSLTLEKSPMIHDPLGRRITHSTVRAMEEQLWDGMHSVANRFPRAHTNMQAFTELAKQDDKQSRKPVSIEQLLLITPCMGATIVYDRLNGLLALAEESSHPSSETPTILKAGYGMALKDWNRNLTWYIIKSCQSLRIWQLIRRVPRPHDLPSWVVDFGDSSPNLLTVNVCRPAPVPGWVAPSNHANAAELHSDGDTLVVQGIQIDTVKMVSVPLDSSAALVQSWKMYTQAVAIEPDYRMFVPKALSFLCAWLMQSPSELDFASEWLAPAVEPQQDLNSEHPQYEFGVQKELGRIACVRGFCLHLLECFKATGETTGSWVKELNYQLNVPHKAEYTHPEYWRMLRTNDPRVEHYRRFLQHRLRIQHRIPHGAGQAMFWTSGKRCTGRGPRDGRPGDAICELIGSDFPVVLRETNIRGRFTLIGPCYLADKDLFKTSWIKSHHERHLLEKGQSFHIV